MNDDIRIGLAEAIGSAVLVRPSLKPLVRHRIPADDRR